MGNLDEQPRGQRQLAARAVSNDSIFGSKTKMKKKITPTAIAQMNTG